MSSDPLKQDVRPCPVITGDGPAAGFLSSMGAEWAGIHAYPRHKVETYQCDRGHWHYRPVVT